MGLPYSDTGRGEDARYTLQARAYAHVSPRQPPCRPVAGSPQDRVDRADAGGAGARSNSSGSSGPDRTNCHPRGDWRTCLLLGGRGSGKTRAAAEWVRAEIEAGRRRQIGIIAPTADTLRRICVEGPSGLLMTAPPWNRPSFEPSTRRVVYPGGGVVHLFSAEEPDRLRGPNLDGLWIDELTSMANASECWDMAQMALRIPGPKGDAPRVVITPRRSRRHC